MYIYLFIDVEKKCKEMCNIPQYFVYVIETRRKICHFRNRNEESLIYILQEQHRIYIYIFNITLSYIYI